MKKEVMEALASGENNKNFTNIFKRVIKRRLNMLWKEAVNSCPPPENLIF